MSNLAYDRRFTDRDVRESPAYVHAAEDFLRGYGGDFEFLVDAKHRLHTDGSLPTSVVRGVLNCMKADPRYRGPMPSPLAPRLGLSLVDARRPFRFRLEATFNKRYLVSTWKTAWLAHEIKHDESKLWFYTQSGTYAADITLWCRANVRQFVMTNAVPLDKQLCTRCEASREEWTRQ